MEEWEYKALLRREEEAHREAAGLAKVAASGKMPLENTEAKIKKG